MGVGGGELAAPAGDGEVPHHVGGGEDHGGGHRTLQVALGKGHLRLRLEGGGADGGATGSASA